MTHQFDRSTEQSCIEKLTRVFGQREASNIWRALMEDMDWGKISDSQGGKEKSAEVLFQLVQKAADGWPVQYLTGKAHFYGRIFKLNREVLIPRPETEELVHECLKEIKPGKRVSVLDIGTGSGCLAITIALERPNAEVVAVDLSGEALEIAEVNAKQLGADLRFKKVDFLKDPGGVGSGFDFLVSNPPYISEDERSKMSASTLSHEPDLALFPLGDDPLVFYRRIAHNLAHILKPGGGIFLELNEYRAADIRKIFHPVLSELQILGDMQGKERILKGRL
jgi:release factor glutamine methyltransferase